MHALELRVGRVARGAQTLEQPRRTEPLGDVRDAVGRLGMVRFPQMLGIQLVVDDDHDGAATVTCAVSPSLPDAAKN
jgi:hypothetical protein